MKFRRFSPSARLAMNVGGEIFLTQKRGERRRRRRRKGEFWHEMRLFVCPVSALGLMYTVKTINLQKSPFCSCRCCSHALVPNLQLQLWHYKNLFVPFMALSSHVSRPYLYRRKKSLQWNELSLSHTRTHTLSLSISFFLSLSLSLSRLKAD